MAGDIESAALGAHFYTAQSIFTGTSLPDLEKQSAALTMEMVNLKQFTPCIAHLCNHQTLLSLLGSKENPFLAVSLLTVVETARPRLVLTRIIYCTLVSAERPSWDWQRE